VPIQSVVPVTPVTLTPRLLTIKQAAVYCSCAVWAIREAIWAKELAACKIGRRFVVPREELDSFIDARLRGRASGSL
jgi:excisionase family DNA binding protein